MDRFHADRSAAHDEDILPMARSLADLFGAETPGQVAGALHCAELIHMVTGALRSG